MGGASPNGWSRRCEWPNNPHSSMDEWTLSNEREDGSAEHKFRQLKELFQMEKFRVLL